MNHSESSQRICIANMWYGANYGAVLTAFALCQVLHQLGHTTALLPPALKHGDRHINSPFRQFLTKRGIKTLFAPKNEEEAEILNNSFDTFIVGSDQVWRYEYTYDLPGYHFFLDFVKPGKRKIAVAASIGSEQCEAPDSWRIRASHYLRAFDAISLRETESLHAFAEQYRIQAESILDPVFLCSKETWNDYTSSHPNQNKPYIFSYILDDNPVNNEIVRKMAEKENAAICHIRDGYQSDTLNTASVEQWLDHIRHCKYLVTDSFHGVCFALIFNKPFICIANHQRGYIRFSSLLGLVNLTDRMVDTNYSDKIPGNLPEIDWSRINAVMDAYKERSIQWIKDALKKDKTPNQLAYEQLLQHIYLLESNIRQMTTLQEPGDFKQIMLHALALPYLQKKYRKLKFKYTFSFGKKRKKIKAEFKQIKNMLRVATNSMSQIQKYLTSLVP